MESNNLAEIVSFEESFDRIRNIAQRIKHKPVVIGVYGLQNHGKTYFTRKAFDSLAKGSNPFNVLTTKDNKRLVDSHLGYFDRAEFYFVEAATTPEREFVLRETNREFRNIKGRDIDLNVLILNPNLYKADIGECRRIYNLIIENPDSKIKGMV